MKPLTFVSRTLLVLCLATLALAQTHGQAHQRLIADVPFDFMIEQVMFPAGGYEVSLDAGHTFQLQAQHGRESVKIEVQPIRTASHPDGAALIFANDNGHLRLRELWINATTGSELPTSEQVYTVGASHVEIPLTPYGPSDIPRN